jgi:hypothetical protein
VFKHAQLKLPTQAPTQPQLNIPISQFGQSWGSSWGFMFERLLFSHYFDTSTSTSIVQPGKEMTRHMLSNSASTTININLNINHHRNDNGSNNTTTGVRDAASGSRAAGMFSFYFAHSY